MLHIYNNIIFYKSIYFLLDILLYYHSQQKGPLARPLLLFPAHIAIALYHLNPRLARKHRVRMTVVIDLNVTVREHPIDRNQLARLREVPFARPLHVDFAAPFVIINMVARHHDDDIVRDKWLARLAVLVDHTFHIPYINALLRIPLIARIVAIEVL
jgi:hypothetical protein